MVAYALPNAGENFEHIQLRGHKLFLFPCFPKEGNVGDDIIKPLLCSDSAYNELFTIVMFATMASLTWAGIHKTNNHNNIRREHS